MTSLGINFPNDYLLPDDLGRMVACGFSDFLLYVTDPRDLTYWVGRAKALRVLQPSARIHVRLEARGTLALDADVAALNRALAAFGDLLATLRIRNEPNIESPGVTPDDWHAYLCELVHLVNDPRLSVPAISPGPDDALAWIQASCDAATVAGYRIVDCHAYGPPSLIAATIAEYRNVWSGRLIVTESNPGAGNAFDVGQWALDIPREITDAQRQGVEAFCLFSWEWVHPDLALPTSVDVRGSAVEEFLQKEGHIMTENVTDGVDVSNLQGAIDFKALAAAGKKFVWLKATEGAWEDPEYAANAKAAADAGLEVRAYCFARFDQAQDGAAEADFFLKVVGDTAVKFAIDVEVGTGNLSWPTLVWLNRVQQAKGPGVEYVYSDPSIVANQLTDPALRSFKLWLADWGVSAAPAAVGDWAVSCWQYSDQGTAPGVSGAVDLDQDMEGSIVSNQPAKADPDFAQYAPKTGTWREAAVNLKGICSDALEAGRRERDRLKTIADSATAGITDWGNR